MQSCYNSKEINGLGKNSQFCNSERNSQVIAASLQKEQQESYKICHNIEKVIFLIRSIGKTMPQAKE